MLRRRPAPETLGTSQPAMQARGLAARLPFHYSWIIIAILATVQIFASSISMAAGIMLPPLTDKEGAFGWNESLVTLGIAAYYGFGALYAPVTGWLGDRFGSRVMLLAAATLYLISMLLLSRISEVWQFFLFFGVLLSLTQSLGMVPLMASVSGWFRRRLGLGIGILWAAGGIGTAAFAPIAGWLIENLGWQNNFVVIGLIGGIAMLCLVPLMRNRPADLGIEPYGARPGDTVTAKLAKGLEQLRIKTFNQHIRRTRPLLEPAPDSRPGLRRTRHHTDIRRQVRLGHRRFQLPGLGGHHPRHHIAGQHHQPLRNAGAGGNLRHAADDGRESGNPGPHRANHHVRPGGTLAVLPCSP